MNTSYSKYSTSELIDIRKELRSMMSRSSDKTLHIEGTEAIMAIQDEIDRRVRAIIAK